MQLGIKTFFSIPGPQPTILHPKEYPLSHTHTQEKEERRPRDIFTSLLWEGEYAEELREDSSVGRTTKWPNQINDVTINFFRLI